MADFMYLENYEALARAIVRNAAREYVDALRALRRNPDNENAARMKEENERFFRSEWYMMLTDIDGEYLIRKLQEEVANGR